MGDTFLGILLSVLAVCVAIIALVFLVVPLCKGVAWLIRHVFRFVIGEISDVLRIGGGVITSVIFVPLVLFSVVFGRWSASSHYGSAIKREMSGIAHASYRILIGHPARLLGLRALTEGFEQRVPDAMANAPTSDKPSRRTGQFEGYAIVGSLKGGGSGAKIYIADPDDTRLASFARAGRADVNQVVIKSFSLQDGSSLPQIVRESRALEAAKKIGLVLEHELNDHRFYYVMPYVPGESMGVVAQQLHAASGAEGLTTERLREAASYVADLLRTLDRYHQGGLWHKDVKPDNIIVHAGRAHLVDLGLVTPLTSGMTLTTHGTEYFRDPEMVRLALRGVKVHEVDGARFDLYAAGAVLYSIIENSFPAHGGLSQVTKRCPEALRWIIRRAMTDYNARYVTAGAMLADVSAVVGAPDPFGVRPIDLPSMSGASAEVVEASRPVVVEAFNPAPQAPAGAPSVGASPAVGTGPMDPRRQRTRPRLFVADWWTGRYSAQAADGPAVAFASPAAGSPRPPRPRPDLSRTATEQLEHARAMRERAQARIAARLGRSNRYSNSPNGGVAFALIVLVGALAFAGFKLAGRGSSRMEQPNVVVQVDGLDRDVNEDAHEAIRSALERVHGASNEKLADTVEDAGQQFATFVLNLSRNAARALAHAGNSPTNVTIGSDGLRVTTSRLEDVEAAPDIEPAEHADAPPPPGRSSRTSARNPRPWLILDDTRDRASMHERAGVQVALSRLRDEGFLLTGLGDDPRELELLAGARSAIGATGLPTDKATKRRLSSWLKQHDASLLGVVWIEMDPAGAGPIYYVIATSGRDGDKASAAITGAPR